MNDPDVALLTTYEERELLGYLREKAALYKRLDEATRVQQDVRNKLECATREIDRLMGSIYKNTI